MVKFIAAFLLISFCSGSFVWAKSAKPKREPVNELKISPDAKWLNKELLQAGVSNRFRKLMIKQYDKKSFSQVMKLNVLGFLKPANHMNLVSDEAVKACRKFIKKNKDDLMQAQRDYQVSPEAVSALLWIETRHGSLKGRFHVASVYLHLMQGNREGIKNKLLAYAKKEKQIGTPYTEKEMKNKIEERTKRKSLWAIEQVKALEEINSTKLKNIKNLRGSFAGAFGVPQFIPSSYKDFALPSQPETNSDLFKVSDSILSVANYLNLHGWNQKNPESKIKALMDYNNSRDYADSILEIEKRLLN